MSPRHSLFPAILVLVWIGCAFAPSSAAARTATRATEAPVDYDIVYVRAPRFGDLVNATLPEVATPLVPDPGADLMLLHPNGTQEVLFAAGVDGAVVDPTVSFDAASVVFAFYQS